MKSKPKPGKKAKKTAARAPRRARDEDLELDDAEEDDEELELEDGDDDVTLQLAVDELQGGGDGGSIRVKKLEPKDEAGDCESYPVSVWPTLTEQLRADWGDGKYAITLRRANGQIAGRGIRQLARRAAKASPTLDVLQVKRETREELQAQMAPMLSMMQSAFNALIGRPASAAADPIDSFVKLHKLTDRGDGGHKSFLEGIQFAKELVGQGGNAGVADVAIKFLDKLTFEPTPAASSATSSSSSAPATRSREEVMQIVKRAIAQRIPILLRGAIQGTEASVYAQLVLDQLPDQYLAIVAEQLKRTDWWEELVAIAPDVGPHRAWFATLRDEVLREIEAPPAPAG